MTTTVNISNPSTPTINNLLDDRIISPILEETTAERTSDLALRTLQESLSELNKELKELRKQFSIELNQLSLKLSLILQNQDRLSKKLEEQRKQPIISICPPPPPPPPSPKISLSLQTTTTLTSEMQPTGNFCRSQFLHTKASKEPIATEQQIAEGLKNLRSSKNGNATSLSLQTSTVTTPEAQPTPTKKLHQTQLMHIEKKQDENDKKLETEETMSVAAIREKFKSLSKKPN